VCVVLELLRGDEIPPEGGLDAERHARPEDAGEKKKRKKMKISRVAMETPLVAGSHCDIDPGGAKRRKKRGQG